MFRKISFVAFLIFFLTIDSPAQTTNGLITGVITDSSGAVIPGAQINVTNQVTGELRKTVSDNRGVYVIPQLAPGAYRLSVAMQDFATEEQSNIQLQVNSSVTLNFKLKVSSSSQTVQVTGAPPLLNTTAATIMDVTSQRTLVGLPLNGRQFTQLTLLAPGAVAQEAGNQGGSLITVGAGGVIPNVNGQNSRENNFTMDGTLNNSIYINFYAITPPPDALQEFNLQSHITDAQFAISSGANINVATRAGTNEFHGSIWEFIRNSALDSQQFPETRRNPYKQNQYGVYLGGPLLIPSNRITGNKSTWFSLYWEGFRSNETLTSLISTLTTPMTTGDFSALEGTTPIGKDDLGRPEYANEIYDPATSRADPINPTAIIRDPFPGNIIPAGRINPDAPLIAKEYYPAPNLNVAATVLPNYSFSLPSITASDETGIRLDHRFLNNNMLFGRYNRQNVNYATPGPVPLNDYSYITNYAQEAAVGYTQLFGQATILNLHYGWTNTNVVTANEAAGAGFMSALSLTLAAPPISGLEVGPTLSIANGFAAVTQATNPDGPQWNEDYHADLSKIVRGHTLGAGLMYYHLHGYSSGGRQTFTFTQNATSVSGATTTGYGPASFMLGLPDSYIIFTGNYSADQKMNWYGGYLQDQWQASPKLAISYGIRYDFVSPPHYTKLVSEVNYLTGQLAITGAYPPDYPKATTDSGLFYPQYDGFQPRFGAAYQLLNHTVLHSAFVVFDDHNNTLIQLNQDPRVSWPTSVKYSPTLLNRGLPSVFINQLPNASTYLNGLAPYASYATNPHNKIAYVMQYNLNLEQQLASSLLLDLGYVGSVGRHLFIEPTGNTAEIPGPGSLASRGQPYPQWPVLDYDMLGGSSAYNALQAKLKKSLSSKLQFMASYTWSKSMDIESDGFAGTIENIYKLGGDWGPSDYNRTNIFVLSGVYSLPMGKDEKYLSRSNGFVQAIAGNWNIGSILTLQSGRPTDAVAGSDVANVGGGTERAERTGLDPYAGHAAHQWLNPTAFAEPAEYTFGNERRNDLVGPSYKDWDFDLFKDVPVKERLTCQFRAEFFNLLNHTNYGLPNTNVASSAFGSITGSAGSPREIQFALKILF